MVAAISQKLFDANCNIEDATMTRLCGEFAMILVVAPARDHSAATLSSHLTSLHQSHGLTISCIDFDDTDQPSDQAGARWMLSAYGPDKTGLVARLSGVLAQHNANITDLQTRVAASHSLYVMLFEIEVPAAFDVERLRAALEATATELGIEYSLHPIDEDAL